MRYILSLLFVVVLIFPQFVKAKDYPVITPIPLEEKSDLRELKKHPFLKKDFEDYEKLKEKLDYQENYKIDLYTKLFTTEDGKKLLFVKETAILLCGARNCPFKIFDVTNKKNIKNLMDISTSEGIYISECPHTISILLAGWPDSYSKWTLKNEKFEHGKIYKDIESASQCE